MTCTVIAIAVYLWAALTVAFGDISCYGPPRKWHAIVAVVVYLAWPTFVIGTLVQDIYAKRHRR